MAWCLYVQYMLEFYQMDKCIELVFGTKATISLSYSVLNGNCVLKNNGNFLSQIQDSEKFCQGMLTVASVNLVQLMNVPVYHVKHPLLFTT